MLEHEKFYLRPIDYSDTLQIVKWINNPNFLSACICPEPITVETHLKYMKEKIITGEVIQFIIVLKHSNESVGTVY